MPRFHDQMGRLVGAPEHPKRVISLVPSQTELLHDLGLGDRVVGITKFCVHPVEWLRTKPRVGGTKKVDLAKVRALKPDLIIGNKEENAQADIADLEREFPVWMSDVRDLEGALGMIEQVGRVTGTTERAQTLCKGIQAAFGALEPLAQQPTAAYFIWKDPWMLAGKHTFIHAMMLRCGFNLPIGIGERYPEVTAPELASMKPSVALLSSEPYPFGERHIGAVNKVLPGIPVELVDGEMFSWYGSRLLHAPPYFRQLMERLMR